MTYTPTVWAQGVAPALSATNLNHIEAGIAGAHAALPRRPLPTVVGWYRSALGGGISAQLRNEGYLELAPFVVTSTETYDRITVEVTVAGSAGALVRVGVYNVSESTGLPTTLALDAGTVDGTVAAVSQIVINLTLPPGTYALGAAIQGAASTRPTLRVLPMLPGLSVATVPGAFSTGGWIATSVTGALPSPVTVVAATTAYVPHVHLRRSA